MEEVVEILPTAHSVLNIENIDKDDGENPQLVVEYVNEIYAYLRHLENVQNVREKYLSGKNVANTSIMPKMRGVLVDWLIQVHQQFNLLQETLYLTVAILDRFLQVSIKKLGQKYGYFCTNFMIFFRTMLTKLSENSYN